MTPLSANQVAAGVTSDSGLGEALSAPAATAALSDRPGLTTYFAFPEMGEM